jgi:hypothetical protein
MNQKIDLRKKKVALFAYEQEFIYGYELAADHRTKPALVTVRKRGRVCLDAKTRGTRKPEHWKRMKNLRFLDYAKKIVGEENFGAAYLSGDELNDKCYDETRNYLCNHAKKVLYGVELYAEGACYSAMHYAGWNVNRDLLYTGEDMLAYNVSMDMLLKGKEERVVLIHAGCSYYMAYRSCEFIPDGTDRILIYSTDLYGKEKSHEIELDGLPKRPNRATRIRMELTFQSQELCKVRLEDLGFGELFESSGKVWETVIRM